MDHELNGPLEGAGSGESSKPLPLCAADCEVFIGPPETERPARPPAPPDAQQPTPQATAPAPLPSALSPVTSPTLTRRGEAEAEIRAEEERPMRSQLLLDLPPVVPWPFAVDGRVLLDELKQLHEGFAVLPRWAAVVLPLFVLHTYAYELRDVCTYLGLESPMRRCGKTTVMTLLSELVNRPEPAANISAPAFFRTIDEMRPTLLIDEADTLLPGNHQLRGILNSGYSRKLAYVIRVTNERLDEREAGGALERREAGGSAPSRRHGRSRLARFSCWGPKVIAQIGHLPETLADRCLVIRMQRKMPSERCERLQRLKDLEETTLPRLRQQCARFVLDHRQEIAPARPVFPPGLHDRAADIAEPLLALADVAGGPWPAMAREAVVGLAASAEQSSPISILLLDILQLFTASGAGRMFTRTLLEGLKSLPNRPWAEARRGKPLTDRWLADELRPFEIRSRTIWIGEMQGKGYLEEEFQEASERYISHSEVEALRDQEVSQRPEVGPVIDLKSEAKNPGGGGSGPKLEAGGAPGDDAAVA